VPSVLKDAWIDTLNETGCQWGVMGRSAEQVENSWVKGMKRPKAAWTEFVVVDQSMLKTCGQVFDLFHRLKSISR